MYVVLSFLSGVQEGIRAHDRLNVYLYNSDFRNLMNYSGYMLDTNIVSHVIKGDRPEIRERLTSVPMHAVVISSVTQAELHFGLAKRSYPKGLSIRVHEFLIRVDILPWSSEVATVYGDLRATCEAAGITLSPLDMMIAAHAKAINAVLVTRDQAFSRIPDGLRVENW